MKILKKLFIIFIFFLFLGNNTFFVITKTNAIYSEAVRINIEKAKIIKSGIIRYKSNLKKIIVNYDLKQYSILQKNINKIDLILIKLNKIILNQLDYSESNNFLKKVVKDFNLIKKQNSLYLKNILKKVKNPEDLKKTKKEFDLLSVHAARVSYKLNSLIYKFKKFLDKGYIKDSFVKKELRKSLKKLYIVSLKLKNFRKYIYMGKKPPKSTFNNLLSELKKEVIRIKYLLRK